MFEFIHESEIELSWVKYVSRPSVIYSKDGDNLDLEFREFLTAAVTLLLSMLGNILTLSDDTKMALSGTLFAFRSLNISSRW